MKKYKAAMILFLIVSFVFISFSESESPIRNGDTNGDGQIDVSDAVGLLNYIFLGGSAPIAIAQDVSPDLSDLETRVSELTASVAQLADMGSQLADLESVLNRTRSRVSALEDSVAEYEATVLPVLDPKTTEFVEELSSYAHFETFETGRDPARTLVLKDINLQIYTENSNNSAGTGNLIVGRNLDHEIDPYPQEGFDQPDPTLNKWGVNNLIVGNYHRYTGNGGVVFGESNEISSFSTTVLGGKNNRAVGNFSTVLGGENNQTISAFFTIAGGKDVVGYEE